MTVPLAYFFRKKGLKKYGSTIKTGMIPLTSVQDVTVLLDSADRHMESSVKLINDFFRNAGIKPDIIYIDTRNKKARKKGAATDPIMTFERKDLNWYGRLKTRFLKSFMEAHQDLYIDLTVRDDYPVVFMSKVIPAKFKVGCIQSRNTPFNLTVTSPDPSDIDSTTLFKGIMDLLVKIK